MAPTLQCYCGDYGIILVKYPAQYLTQRSHFIICLLTSGNQDSVPSHSNMSYTIPQQLSTLATLTITRGAFKKRQDSGLTAQRVRLHWSGVELRIGVVFFFKRQGDFKQSSAPLLSSHTKSVQGPSQAVLPLDPSDSTSEEKQIA